MAGAEKSLANLVRGLDPDRYDPVVLTLSPEPGKLKDVLDEAGIRNYSIGIARKYQLWKLRDLYTALKSEAPDILQTFLYFDNVFGIPLGRLASVPHIIGGIRNVETHQPLLRRIFERITLPLADMLVSNSRNGRDYYDAYNKDIRVIYNGIPENELLIETNTPNRYPHERTIAGVRIPPDEYAFITIGRLTKQKDYPTLLHAYALIDTTTLPFNHIIIGDGEEHDALIQLRDKLGLTDRVHFAGYQPNAAEMLRNADCFVLPSLWEGMPNVVMEAVARRVPVIATDVGGVSEIVSETLIEPGNPSALADALYGFLATDTNTESAYNYLVTTFTLPKMISSFDRTYSELTARIRQ